MIERVVKMFEVLFRLIAILLVTGTMATVLHDIQALALSQHHGLVGMLSVNQQLVGHTKK